MHLLLALTALVAAAFADDTYVVIAPSTIRPGAQCTLSVNIIQSSWYVYVSAAIWSLNNVQKVVTAASGLFHQGKPGELHLRIPEDLGLDTYELRVTGNVGLTFKNSAKLKYERKQMSIFIQTDKAVYKPGDTVNFRVLAIYPNLKPYYGPMDIYISDADSNKIRQFVGVNGTEGVVTKALSLSTQPVLGDWKIHVKSKDVKKFKVFTIDEYVLPKFEVKVDMPSYVVSSEKQVDFTVKAKYTYGKPVKGKLNVAVKLLNSYQNEENSAGITPFYQTTLDIKKATKVSFLMSTAQRMSRYLSGRKFLVQAKVTESLTGKTLHGSGMVTIYNKAYKLEFPGSNPNTFKPGLDYTAYLKVSEQDGSPVSLSTKKVTITTTVTASNHPTPLPILQLPVPVNGLVMVPISVPENAKSIYITANYDQTKITKTISKSYSPSNTYIQLSLKTSSQITAGRVIKFGVKATQHLGKMIYQVLSRGQIVKVGAINGNNKKYVTFALSTTSKMAPNARIVVYYVRQDGEIVTDSISFDVAGIFHNKVSIRINETVAEPGEAVKVTVSADPFSHAHLLAVDQSVLLLKSGNDITDEDVCTELKTYDTIKSSSFWGSYPVYYGGRDAKAIFENAGVLVLTDALVYKYVKPRRYGWFMPWRMRSRRLGYSSKSLMMSPALTLAFKGPVSRIQTFTKSLKKPPRARTHFPETWLWNTLSTGSDGKADLLTSVPHTITSWIATAFAVHPTSGLGVSSMAAKFKVFRPFFVSLNLPYSVVRGEHLVLQAIVFNYMAINQQVRVTLQRSNSFLNIRVNGHGSETTFQGDAVQNILVKAGEAKSVYFPIIPVDLGRIDLEVKAQTAQAADALRRQLLVEAEGVPKEYNVPVLINLQKANRFTKTVDLTLPPNVVPKSQLTKISVYGDVMGPSISGIDRLLRMPTGCGEQNMIGLAPDVYITEYLTSTNQLTGAVKVKALSYMEKGYQRELTYKHTDGSFSAFGKRDRSGSMWLTAFVCKVFHQARPHIYVDDNVLRVAISWIIRHQKADGSFPEPGRVIHKNMQGNAAGGASLTTFVLISLLENQDLYTCSSTSCRQFHTAKQKALAYLEKKVASSSDLFFMAMTSYALQLGGSSHTDELLKKLSQAANHDAGLYHLQHAGTKKATKGVWHSPKPTKAIDTEMTSYLMLTYALRQDIEVGKKLMQWVTEQRNPNGGFSSTQDTVVALNALSKMAKLLFKNVDIKIDTTLDSSPVYSFQVNSSNSAILQRRETTTVPAKVKIDAVGSGTALVEVAVYFNVESEVEDTTFYLQVNLIDETLKKLTVKTCTRWLGDGSASGMAVQEIGIPSGFQADLDSFTKLTTLKRTETQDKKVILYFDEIGSTDVCVSFVARRTGLVSKSQPAVVRVYDYYEPSNQVTGFYQSQQLKDSSMCDVCEDCDTCVET